MLSQPATKEKKLFGNPVRRKSWTTRPFFARLPPPWRASFFLIHIFKFPIQILMFSKVLFSLFILLPSASAVESPAGFILLFQPLYELPTSTTQPYLAQLRKILHDLPDKNIDRLLIRNYQNDTCAKKKLKTCVHGLYSTNKCLHKKDSPSKICFKKTKNRATNSYFEESVFNRLNWNHFAIQISHSCQKSLSKTCKALGLLHSKYFKIYRNFIIQKRKKQKSKKAWDL